MSYPFEDDKYATLPEDDFIVYCPVVESNTVATVVNGDYVCPRCEQVEGSNGSMFHGLPR